MAFRNDLLTLLEAASVGTRGTTIFVGRKAKIPVTSPGADTPILSLIVTGGTGPDYIQNQLAPAYQRPGCQLTARAFDPAAAETMARMAYNALAGIRNTVVSGGVHYLSIKPMQEPFEIDQDEAGRSRYVFNVMADKVPSVS